MAKRGEWAGRNLELADELQAGKILFYEERRRESGEGRITKFTQSSESWVIYRDSLSIEFCKLAL
jgi:hypothetical protein